MKLYTVTLRQRLFEQDVITDFSFASLTEPVGMSGALALLTLLGFVPDVDHELPVPTLAGRLLGLQTSDVTWVEVEARNLYSDTDFYNIPYNPAMVGLFSPGVCTNIVAAYGIFSNRVRTDIRRGFKRFAGVADSALTVGGVVVDDAAIALGQVASALSGTQTDPEDADLGQYTSSIFHYEEYTTPKGNKAYKPFATEAEQIDNTAVGVEWSPYARVRSQTSRQFGHGS